MIYEVDLHYYSVKNALDEVKKTMQSSLLTRFRKYSKICFIVGQGKHNPKNIPVLKKRVKKWLHNNNFKPYVEMFNPGRVYVNVSEDKWEKNRDDVDSFEIERSTDTFPMSKGQQHLQQLLPFGGKPMLLGSKIDQQDSLEKGYVTKNQEDCCCTSNCSSRCRIFFLLALLIAFIWLGLMVWWLIFAKKY